MRRACQPGHSHHQFEVYGGASETNVCGEGKLTVISSPLQAAARSYTDQRRSCTKLPSLWVAVWDVYRLLSLHYARHQERELHLQCPILIGG